MYKFALLFSVILLFSACAMDDEMTMNPNPVDPTVEMYFPPAQHSEWLENSPDSLGWDRTHLNELVEFLGENKTKGFIMLKDGRMVVEEYFGDHTINKNWNWFSAAKSLTSTVVGIAEDEMLLDLDEKTSTYLGNNWSNLEQEQQDLITVRNHISMATGLQNPIGNFLEWTCTTPICMKYEADAGTRWAYHQGAFTLTQNIVTKAVGENFKQYCKEKILDKIGMNGTWNDLLGVRIFSSTTRSMARFGLLALNKGEWDEEVIYPASYHDEMIKSSQDLNKAYGYLWWLNGQEDFLGTKDQTLFNGSLIPNAPDDMFCALGAQDQKIYVVPSQNLVVVRCGDSAGNEEFASSSFDNHLWERISLVLP